MRYYKFVLTVHDPLDDVNPLKTHVIFERGDDHSILLFDAFDSVISICNALAVDFVSFTEVEVTNLDIEEIEKIQRRLVN